MIDTGLASEARTVNIMQGLGMMSITTKGRTCSIVGDLGSGYLDTQKNNRVPQPLAIRNHTEAGVRLHPETGYHTPHDKWTLNHAVDLSA